MTSTNCLFAFICSIISSETSTFAAIMPPKALVGPLLDTCSVFLAANELNAKAVLGIYMAGVPVNLSQAVCTFLTLLLVGKPFLEKLDRIRVKYGMMEAENGL